MSGDHAGAGNISNSTGDSRTSDGGSGVGSSSSSSRRRSDVVGASPGADLRVDAAAAAAAVDGDAAGGDAAAAASAAIPDAIDNTNTSTDVTSAITVGGGGGGDGSPRDVFDAFFLPPVVPASLALLALCEGLGRQSPESSISRQLPAAPFLDYTDSSCGGSGGGDDIGDGEQGAFPERGGGGGGSLVPVPARAGANILDARTVQHACRLLELYLQEPNSETETAAAEGELARSRKEVATNNGLGAGRGGRGGRAGGSAPDSRSSLLVRAVMELADGRSCRAIVEETGRNAGEAGGAARDGGYGVGVGVRAWDFDGPALVGGHAADGLSSALCLVPQRVANGLGPIAPPSFAPGMFYPTVCRAVVEAALACLEEAPTVGREGEGEEGRWGGGEEGGEGRGGWRGGERGAGGDDVDDDVDVGVDFDVAAAGDVWRAFSGRLLTAGRASDLADAWLLIMSKNRIEGDGASGMEPAAGGASAGRWGRAGGAGSDHPIRGNSNTSRGDIEEMNDTPAATTAAAAARWEAWAERPGGAPEMHAWMMTRLPASRRKPFTEAVLRALWPRASRHRHHHPRRRHNGGWPPGFQTAVCRVLVGRPLVGARQPMRRRRGSGSGGGGGGGGGDGASGGGGGGEDGRGSGLEGDQVAIHSMNAIDAGGSSLGAGVGEEDQDGSVDVSVGLVEGLLLQRPLPLPAAEAVADTLAWCDRRRHGVTDVRASATATAAAYTGRRAGGVGSWGGSKEGEGERGGLVIRALKRVAAVWAEPSFLNRSPPRQQEFYTRFLLAALRR